MKYDWSEIPEHIMWIAADADGFVFVYGEKPEKSKLMDGWASGGYCDHLYQTQPEPNWQNSLEARP